MSAQDALRLEVVHLTIIRLELCDIVGDRLLRPVYCYVEGHKRRLPEVATVEVEYANIYGKEGQLPGSVAREPEATLHDVPFPILFVRPSPMPIWYETVNRSAVSRNQNFKNNNVLLTASPLTTIPRGSSQTSVSFSRIITYRALTLATH